MPNATMTSRTNDPLLLTTRLLLTLFLALFAFGIAALVIAFALLPFPIAQDHFVDLGLAPGVSSWQYTGRVIVMMLLIGAFLISGLIFTLSLRRIVDTVSAGEPFCQENALRLKNMGFAVLALVVCGLLQPFVVAWVDQLLAQTDAVRNHTISADGLLAALVLFILARVFRQGAAMRDDLEGTV